MPQTRSRCFSERAIEAMRIDEVLEARMVSGGTTASSSPNSFCLTSRFSNTASTMTWQAFRSSILSATARLASVLARSASVSRPLATRPFSVSRIAAFAFAAPPAAASNMIAFIPPCAVTCAMPRPMAPVPTTPTTRSGRFTSRAIRPPETSRLSSLDDRCHPERSEGPFLRPQRSLATLGMTALLDLLTLRSIPRRLQPAGDLVEGRRVLDGGRHLPGLAVGDLLHGAAQDLARARLGQARHDDGGLEEGDGADAVAHELDDLAHGVFLRPLDARLQHQEAERHLALQF